MSTETPVRVVVERVLPGTPDDVFVAWTTAETLRTFMCPENATTVHAEVDARVGGRFRLVMRDDGRDFEVRGEYRVVEPGRRLVFTGISPGTLGRESLVTIELTPLEDGTKLVLVHEALATDEAGGRWKRGWTGIVERLARRVPGGGEATDEPSPGPRLGRSRRARARAARLGRRHPPMVDAALRDGRARRRPRRVPLPQGRVPSDRPHHAARRGLHRMGGVESQHQTDVRDGWLGTRIRFELHPLAEDRTRLAFTHVGLLPLDCATTCTKGWTFFLDTGLPWAPGDGSRPAGARVASSGTTVPWARQAA